MYTPRMAWYDFCRGAAALTLRLAFGVRIRVSGRNYVPRQGGFILAANHASNLDPAVLAIACPRQVNFMAKQELFRHLLFGALIRSVRAFPVKRGTADLGSIREAFGRVRKGGGLLLFPQGGRRPLNDMSEPEPGVGMLSQRMGVPVVPAFIAGTDTALPPGSKKIQKGAVLTVTFGPAITLEKSKDYQESSSRIMRAIRSLKSG